MAPASSPSTPNPESSTISRTQVLSKRAPKLTTNKTLTFWRQRIQRRTQGRRVLTAGDRLIQAKKREQHRRDYRDALQEAQGKIYTLAQGLKDRFGKYSIEHYHNDLIHRAHKSRSTRRVNRWNAFQKLELKRMKDTSPGGVNLTVATKEISARWKSLSQEDRITITAGCMEEIEEEREAKNLALHNVPLNAFYDARGTVRAVEKELAQLYARTGLEFLLVACRSSTKDFMKPFIYYSSEVVKGFITDSLNRSMDDLAIQLEAYVMSGLKGVVGNAKTRTLELKKKTTTVILEKLRTLTGVTHTRMAYDRFDELITAKYHVVVKNWPLKKFCNPSAVTSGIELELLCNAWQSGATYFQKLTDEEMEAWENDRFSSRMALMPPPAEPVPALASQPTPPRMTLFSELSHQDLLGIAPTPTPLAPITNLPPELTSTTTTSHPPAPNPDLIAMMIHADPTLQNVDPALIALGITQGNQHQVTTTTTVAPMIAQPSNRVFHASGSKRSWQEVVTPLSYNARAAKKPRKQRKEKGPASE